MRKNKRFPTLATSDQSAIHSDSGLSDRLTRSARDRHVISGLIFVLFISLIVYLSATLSSANASRVRLAADRNANTARLCAQLLEEQCQSAFSVLRALAHRPALETSVLRKEKTSVSQSLHDAVDLVPDLLVAAVYSADGTIIGKYPNDVNLQTSITHERWFQQIAQASTQQLPSFNGVVRLPNSDNTQAFTVAIPVQSKKGQPAGYLLAYFRLGNFYDWLKSIQFTSGTVMIIDSSGRIAATSGDLNGVTQHESARFKKGFIRAGYAPYERAKQGKEGAKIDSLPPLVGSNATLGKEEQLVGYAFSSLSGCVVLVAQPTEAAFAPSQYLLRRLAIIGIPLLLAVPLVGWTLVQLYGRLQQLAFALGQRNELLRHLNQAKSDLLANVSHDLKTPIASMQISVSGLLEGESQAEWEPQQVKDCLNLVSQELDALAARVRNLLDMSRLESETASILREPCDLIDIVATALERVLPLAQGRAISTDFPPTPLMVMCDPSQLETVVLNLLENALKYSPVGSPLRLVGAAQKKEVVFTVRDYGEGLPDGEEIRVFEKFFRAGTSIAPGGTGLGLAICETILEVHGGSIAATTVPDGGAEFRFILPLCEVHNVRF